MSDKEKKREYVLKGLECERTIEWKVGKETKEEKLGVVIGIIALEEMTGSL